MKVYCLYDEMQKIMDINTNPKLIEKDLEAKIAYLDLAGIREPVIVSRRSGIVVKNQHIIEAAKAKGIQEVPVSIQDFESQEQEDLVSGFMNPGKLKKQIGLNKDIDKILERENKVNKAIRVRARRKSKK